MRNAIAILTLLVLFTVSACSKDKYTTIPQFKIKDISPSTAVNRNVIRIELSFTDEEGDLDSVFVTYKWYNGNTVSREYDTLKYSVDGLGVPTRLRNGEVFIEHTYGFIDGYKQLQNTPVAKDTTAGFGIILKDKAGNRSEYKETDKIRFIKN